MKRDDDVFSWSPKSDKAALLLAQGELTDESVAAESGVSRVTIYRWKREAAFRERVGQHASDIRAEIRSRGISVTENRVRHLQRRHDLLNRVIDERGADPGMQSVPGGKTGLMVHNVKAIGSGETAERVDLYEVDTAALAELRAIEKQAAQELGQWEDKSTVTNKGETVVKVLNGVSMADL